MKNLINYFQEQGYSFKYFCKKHKINERTLTSLLNFENKNFTRNLRILKDIHITGEEYLELTKKKE